MLKQWEPTSNQHAVFQSAPPREPGAGRKGKKRLLVAVTCLGLSCDSGGGCHHQTAWSLQSCRGSSSRAGPLIPSRGDENSSVCAPPLPTGSILEMVSGRHDPRRNMLPSLVPAFHADLSGLQGDSFLLLCLILSKWQSSGTISAQKWD